MPGFRIRDADLIADRRTMLDFVMALQHYEHRIEPNRRLDPPVAEEYLALALDDVAQKNGRIFIADDEVGAPIGWAVMHEEEDDVFVAADQRRYAYISDLYVNDTMRGSGIGRALIAACEAAAADLGIAVMQINVLPGNARALGIYHRSGYSDSALQLRKYLR